MSKSWGNVVNPDDVVQEHGADTLRLYEVFMGPFEEPVPWSTNGVIGIRRFLDKVIRLGEKCASEQTKDDREVSKALHKMIEKVSKDIEAFRFNTAVAQLMMLMNTVQEKGAITKDSFALFLRVLVPFAPHVANELWEKLGFSGFVEEQPWPVADSTMIMDDEIELGVQVNGKLRASIIVAADASEDDIIAKARAEENVAKYCVTEPKKTIVVKGKLVNFVVEA
jgi:leucyl-tRNA synthetase